jgi:hypothetical protein
MAVTHRLRKQAVPYKSRLTGRLISENEGFGATRRTPRQFLNRHCEEPTGPAFGRPDDKLRDEASSYAGLTRVSLVIPGREPCDKIDARINFALGERTRNPKTVRGAGFRVCA